MKMKVILMKNKMISITRQTVTNLHNAGLEKQFFSSVGSSILGYRCGVSQCPQFMIES